MSENSYAKANLAAALREVAKRLVNSNVYPEGPKGYWASTASVIDLAAKEIEAYREKQASKREIVYLASPYTHKYPEMREARYKAAVVASAELIREGLVVFSPIAMSHEVSVVMGRDDLNALTSEYWKRFDEAFLDVCDRMIVLRLPGWMQSVGVTREMRHFYGQGKPVEYYDDKYNMQPVLQAFDEHIRSVAKPLAPLEPFDGTSRGTSVIRQVAVPRHE